ncbi:DUF3376 domain-containing protein, partial [Saccharopolyspora kobensis]
DQRGGGRPPTPAPAQLSSEVERYSVGRQRFADLGERRALSLATRFGMLAYRAARPSGGGVLPWLGRRAMTLIKPLALAVVYALAAPRRVALLGLFAATALAFTGTGGIGQVGLQTMSADSYDSQLYTMTAVAPYQGYCPFGGQCEGIGEDFGWFAYAPVHGDWTAIADFSGTSFGPGVLFAMLLVAVFAVWTGSRIGLRFGRGLARWVPALAIAAVLLAAEYWLFSTGFRLGPLGLALAAVLLTWPAAIAYRTGARIGATVLTALVFGGVLVLAEPDAYSGGGWILLAAVLAAYAHMLLLSTVDVLAPRPRNTATR